MERRVTGCERILAHLKRGPCTAAELYAETYTVVHSRISDLRKRGYVITCEHTGGSGASSILYTLEAATPSVASMSSAAGGPEVPTSLPLPAVEQLTLESTAA